MDPIRIIEATLRQAQNLLGAALPPKRSRNAAVHEIRTLLWSSDVNSALSNSSDTVLLFTLREAQMAVADPARTSAASLKLLRSILDAPWVHAALGISQDNG